MPALAPPRLRCLPSPALMTCTCLLQQPKPRSSDWHRSRGGWRWRLSMPAPAAEPERSCRRRQMHLQQASSPDQLSLIAPSCASHARPRSRLRSARCPSTPRHRPHRCAPRPTRAAGAPCACKRLESNRERWQRLQAAQPKVTRGPPGLQAPAARPRPPARALGSCATRRAWVWVSQCPAARRRRSPPCAGAAADDPASENPTLPPHCLSAQPHHQWTPAPPSPATSSVSRSAGMRGIESSCAGMQAAAYWHRNLPPLPTALPACPQAATPARWAPPSTTAWRRLRP